MFDAHYLTHDIIIGKAEIFYSAKQEGWIIPGGKVIRDKVKAIQYACSLHDYIIQQSNFKTQKESLK